MKPRTTAALFAIIGATFLLSTDCVSDHHGSVSVRWSIQGQFDPHLCTAFSASTMRTTIYDYYGYYVTEDHAPCFAFITTIPLHQGTYTATQELLDAIGRPVSTTLDLQRFDIWDGNDVLLDTDFPASSFFYLRPLESSRDAGPEPTADQ